jgi:hypothetical protein
LFAVFVEEFNLTEKITNTVREFIRKPIGRFKHAIPNLHTLIGYIAAMPVDQARKILGYDGNCCDLRLFFFYI